MWRAGARWCCGGVWEMLDIWELTKEQVNESENLPRRKNEV